METLKASKYFLRNKGIVAKLIYFYRFSFPLTFIFLALVSLSTVYPISSNNLGKLSIISFCYIFYLYLLEVIEYRERYTRLLHRIIRVNIDMAYITISCLLIPDQFWVARFVFLLPLISAINYRENRHYFLCATWPLIYIVLLDLYRLIDRGTILNAAINIAVYGSILYSIALIIYVFDKNRSEIDVYSEKIKNFYGQVRVSEHYATTIKVLLSRLRELTNVDFITLSFVDHQKGNVFVVAADGAAEHMTIPPQKVGQGIVGICVKQKKFILVQNVSKDHRYLKVYNLTRSELAVPIKINGTVIGVMNFESEQLDFFDEIIQGVIYVVFDHVVAILRNAFQAYERELKLTKKVDEFRENSLYLRQVVHEIRNKLQGAVQLPNYLLKFVKSEKPDWDFINIQSNQLLTSLRELETSLNKVIESRRLYQPKLAKVRITEVFKDVNHMIFLKLIGESIEYSEFYSSDLEEITMMTDKDYLVSIVSNILINSINAYSLLKSKKNLTIREMVIKHNRFIEKGKLIIRIIDYAGGIDIALARKMSDPSIHFVGTTVGLNIIKSYVNALKGDVQYKNIDKNGRKGVEATVIVPLIYAEE